MTGVLLQAMADLKGPLLLKLGVVLMLSCLLPLSLGVDGLGAVLRSARRRWLAGRVSARCPRGHRVELQGAFTCGSCRLTFEGHAFADPCPHCGADPGTAVLACPCGLYVAAPRRRELL